MSGPAPQPAPPRRRSWVLGALRQRCPRCREGRMFKGSFAMNDPCPVCGLPFEREQGYFFGAMYFSYFLGVFLLIPLYFLLQGLLPQWRGEAVAALTLVPYILLVPAVFRYSRVLWIYFDRAADPVDFSLPARPRGRKEGQP